VPRLGRELEPGHERQESPSAEAERLLYFGLVGAIEEGLVETAQHVLTVLRQAHAPLGPMGEEWLRAPEGGLDQ
jgi:hypothetical protein